MWQSQILLVLELGRKVASAYGTAPSQSTSSFSLCIPMRVRASRETANRVCVYRYPCLSIPLSIHPFVHLSMHLLTHPLLT